MGSSKDLAILILAAGSSSRLGEPKQLLKYHGETLLKQTVKKAFTVSKDIYVVLGHKKDACQKELEELKEFESINLIVHLDYHKGIGSSISYGIQSTQNYQNTMIILCDQPFIPQSHFEALKSNSNHTNIVASLYSDTATVPAIFPKKYYPQLLELDEDKGARSILQKEKCISIPLDKTLAVDIDTQEDKQRYLTP